MSRRKKLFWADEGKREICAQATTLGMSVAQVARHYAVNANLIFKWLKDPHFAPDAEDAVGDDVFLPIKIEGYVVHEGVSTAAPPVLSAPLSANRVDITLSDGRRILVEKPTALTSDTGPGYTLRPWPWAIP